jgi:integrase
VVGEAIQSSLHTWMGDLFDHGAAPGTVRTRQLAVKRLTAWLLATEQLLGDPLVGIKGREQRQNTVIPLSDDALRALNLTCAHPNPRPGDRLHHRRDEALIRLMLETGIRAGEAVGLELRDLELHVHRITIRNGKGGRAHHPRRPDHRRGDSRLPSRTRTPSARERAATLGRRAW